MMKLLLTFCFFCSLGFTTTQKQNRTIKLKGIDILQIDQFGFIYAVKNDKITKYDKDFKVLSSFSKPILGSITHLDVSNALNPAVLFGDTYNLSLLDNRLNEAQTLNLLELDFYDPKLMSVSDQRHLWIYDQSEDKLIRFSLENNTRENVSLNITQILGQENQPHSLVSDFEKVYLNVPEKGILVFDAVGAFLELIPIKDIEQMRVRQKTIYFRKEGAIYRLLKSKKTEKITSKATDLQYFEVYNDEIFLIHPSWIEISQFI